MSAFFQLHYHIVFGMRERRALLNADIRPVWSLYGGYSCRVGTEVRAHQDLQVGGKIHGRTSLKTSAGVFPFGSLQKRSTALLESSLKDRPAAVLRAFAGMILSDHGTPRHVGERFACVRSHARTIGRTTTPTPMQLYPFNALNLKKRTDHLWSHGTFISVCRKQEPYVLYYMIDDFFVELQYDPNHVAILGMIAFDRGAPYDRMVEAMRLERLEQDTSAG